MEAYLDAAGIEKSDVRVTVERKNGKSTYESAAEAAEGLPEADFANLGRIVLHGGGWLGDLTIAVSFLEDVKKILTRRAPGVVDGIARGDAALRTLRRRSGWCGG